MQTKIKWARVRDEYAINGVQVTVRPAEMSILTLWCIVTKERVADNPGLWLPAKIEWDASRHSDNPRLAMLMVESLTVAIQTAKELDAEFPPMSAVLLMDHLNLDFTRKAA